MILLEGMCSISPVEDVEDLVVDAHWDGEAHDSQWDSGEHRDDAELEQGQQADHYPCQDHACPLRVLPVDHVHHWKTRWEEREEKIKPE